MIQDFSDCCPFTYSSYWPFYLYILSFSCFSEPEQCTSDHERDLIIESPLPLGPLEKINVLQNFVLEAIVEEIRFDHPYPNVDVNFQVLAINLNANT